MGMMDTSGPRAETTLFLLMSLDGKITSGESDALDPDWDWIGIKGVREGLHQYYEIEQTTDTHSLITGRTLAKLGTNSRDIPEEPPSTASFLNSIVVDRMPHLTAHGVEYLARSLKRLYLVTNNRAHPAFALTSSLGNLQVIYYPDEVNLSDLLSRLRLEHGVERVTLQSGGTLNAVLLRQGLIDHVSVVVAPLLVGGQATPSLIGGRSLQTEDELAQLKALRLVDCRVLADSYLHLRYDVVNDTSIEPGSRAGRAQPRPGEDMDAT